MEFPEVSRSPLYSVIVKEHLGFEKHENSLAPTFDEEDIGKLVHRHDKCLNRQGDCVEK